RYPDAKFLLTKMGRGIQSIYDSVLAVSLRNSNVFLDMTHTSPAHLTHAVSAIGANRIMYGSDWSATWQNLAIPPDVHSLGFNLIERAELDHESIDRILSQTAKSCFELGSRISDNSGEPAGDMP